MQIIDRHYNQDFFEKKKQEKKIRISYTCKFSFRTRTGVDWIPRMLSGVEVRKLKQIKWPDSMIINCVIFLNYKRV